MIALFSLAVMISGSYSASLQPFIDDLAKKESKVHLNLKSVNTSKDFIADLMTNPKQFVAQFANLDPVELQRIISLLEDLRTTSETRETTLQDTLSRKIAEAVTTGNAVTDANEAFTDAQGVAAIKEQDLSTARAAHDTKVSEKDAAQQELDDEGTSLNDEQSVLTEVINLLRDLAPPTVEYEVLQGYSTTVHLDTTSGLTQQQCIDKVENGEGYYYDPQYDGGYCGIIDAADIPSVRADYVANRWAPTTPLQNTHIPRD